MPNTVAARPLTSMVRLSMVRVVGTAAAIARDARGKAPARQAAPAAAAEPKRNKRRSTSHFIIALPGENQLWNLTADPRLAIRPGEHIHDLGNLLPLVVAVATGDGVL